ncbi:MAG: ArsA family ATPase, partial [Cyanobacteria bacterium Co-bin13]|nr:ArsA family ATPase [Cyanobacteria bacterium Co-bin13]
MALILTFLGSEGADRTIAAIASAKRLAAEGKRVLLAFQDPGPAPSLLLGQPLSADPTSLGENLQAVQFLTAALLERSWDEVKALETQYLRTPLLKSVYGQELGVLPGMDSAIALNSLRQFDASGQYDAIVYSGNGDLTTLRMLGMPEVLDWYVRRFRDVFQQSDLGRTLGPFIPPVAAAVLAVDWSGNVLDRPTGEVRSILEEGKAAINDPNRLMAVLVSRPEETAIASAKRHAAEGKRVLLAYQDPVPAPSQLLGQPLSADPTRLGENLQAVQFLTAALLERSWDEVKALETQYLRT